MIRSKYALVSLLLLASNNSDLASQKPVHPHRQAHSIRNKQGKKSKFTKAIVLGALTVAATTAAIAFYSVPSYLGKSTDQTKQLVILGEKFGTAVLATTNQYEQGSTGACTINALEAAALLKLGYKPTTPLADHIVQVAAHYKSNKHTNVADVLEVVGRYNKEFDLQEEQCLRLDLGRKIDELVNLAIAIDTIAVVVTAVPESIFIFISKTPEFILFDSHPRRENGLEQSHFIIFHDKEMLKKYLGMLFPSIQDLGANIYEQQANMVSCQVLNFKKDPDKDLLTNQEKLRLAYQDFVKLEEHMEIAW